MSILSKPQTDNLYKKSKNKAVIALAGSPNVGKSTVFNALTGLNQHTGNWTGKTVSTAVGQIKSGENTYLLADIPGTYSLNVRSKEEEVARDFLLFGGCDGVICVCDTQLLERGLLFVLQLREYTEKITVCLNLTDQADKKGIVYDEKRMSELLGINFVKCSARKRQGLSELVEKTEEMLESEKNTDFCIRYPQILENAVQMVESELAKLGNDKINERFTAVRLICGETELCKKIGEYAGVDLYGIKEINQAVQKASDFLAEQGISADVAGDMVSKTLSEEAEKICLSAKMKNGASYGKTDRIADKIITGKFTAIPIMLIMLALVFWITLKGANYPSEFLSGVLFSFEDKLYDVLRSTGLWVSLCDMLIHGMYRVVAWVVSVMLPPMAIFFPLFTILEDTGFLPRIAYNLDRCFSACNACGKQALTMCMGFGCNAVGVTGCRIIDSERERLTAILTNSFVPCNGRLPILITVISMFLVVSGGSVKASLVLVAFIVAGIIMTLFASFILSRTVLRGKNSSYIMELPSYRLPDIKNVVVRSFFDRTLIVLGRAVVTAAPMGVVIWCLANTHISGSSVLEMCTDFLDPFGKFFGMDGVIIMAFLLGLPAKEIVIPVAIMCYMSGSTLADLPVSELKSLFASNGWTTVTALCVCAFTVCHFPCATTLMTVKKETGSTFYTFVAAVLPTVFGLAVCFFIKSVAGIIGV